MPPESSKRKPLLRSRLDVALVGRGLAESRALAQRLVLAGRVRISGETALKPSQLVVPEARLEVIAPAPFVSRGGDKLRTALTAFGLDPTGKVCADVGASTGGFTDCLLQAGAARVYAIDVGHGILHWKLREDPRVIGIERTNIRHYDGAGITDAIDLAVIDCSFISLKLVIPPVV